jgi:poly(hydroxyalkanoate) depolymerase family esterase
LKSLRNLYLRFLEQTRSSATSPATHCIDTRGITQTIKGALASAGLDTQSGVARSVTETIEQALASAGLSAPASAAPGRGATIDGVARDVTTSTESPRDGALIGPAVSDEPVRPGDFVMRSFTSDAGTRTYKLYVPASYSPASGERVPLVVMLHGCTQDPDDFAAGTRMNTLADEHGFIVAYPAQETQANVSKCWNWFRAQDQARDRGEPALIAGITREVAAGHRIDERRIFVAGLSAGAAMAVVLAATYPELYAAVGVHSGLPYAAAHDVPSAFAAMKGGVHGRSMPSPEAAADPRSGAGPVIPTIIFHGDHDATVSASNADAIVQQARASRAGESALQSTVSRDTSPNGRGYTRTVLADGAQQPVIEHWVLHGAGHAWSGGSPGGSFTDPTGPDASAEMIRFFYSQPRGGSA